MQAANDPIAPAKAIPKQAMHDNPDCILVITPFGGHLGWVSGPGAPLGEQMPANSTCQPKCTTKLTVLFTIVCVLHIIVYKL